MTYAGNVNGPQPFELMAVISETIQDVSAKAREASITPDSLLLEDLALDSLDLVAVVLRLQDHFQIEIEPDSLSDLRRVGDLVAILTEQVTAAA
jgi:acyl carrier protein